MNQNRIDVRKAKCPYCNAKAGEYCVNINGIPREANHVERVVAHGNMTER